MGLVRRETEDKPCGVKHKAARKRGAKAFRTPTTMNWTAITVTDEIFVPVRWDGDFPKSTILAE